jgi:elongation factor 1-gamma
VNPFAAMAPTTFVFDDWKKQFQNEASDVYVPWFWENFDPTGISIWKGTYGYNEENKVNWMTSNLINGMIDRLEGCRKQLFGITMLMKNNTLNHFEIECMFIMRGTGLIFEIDDGWSRDSESYTWKKLDHTNGEDKRYIEHMLKREFTPLLPAERALEDWYKCL